MPESSRTAACSRWTLGSAARWRTRAASTSLTPRAASCFRQWRCSACLAKTCVARGPT